MSRRGVQSLLRSARMTSCPTACLMIRRCSRKSSASTGERGLLCLDTNIVVFALNGRRPEIAARLDAELSRATPMIVPAIVLFELRYGAAKSAQRTLNEERLGLFLQAGFAQAGVRRRTTPQRPATSARIWRTSGSRSGRTTILIAAQARRRGATLVTMNRGRVRPGAGPGRDGLDGLMDTPITKPRRSIANTSIISIF